MAVKVIRFNHYKQDRSERPSVRYALFCGEPWQGREDMVVLDITREVEADIRKDRRDGFDPESGRCFAWIVWQASRAGEAHAEVTERWRRAAGHDSVRPQIGHSGLWRIYKMSSIEIDREWDVGDRPGT